MDSNGQIGRNLGKTVRELHKLGDRAFGSVLDAYSLNSCDFLAPIRSMTIEILNVEKCSLSEIIFRVRNGVDDQALLLGTLNLSGRKVKYVRVGDPDQKVLFSVGFPNDKKLVRGLGVPFGKIKAHGVQIFRIYAPIRHADDDSVFEVVKVSEAGKNSLMPYLKINKKTTLISKVASCAGMSFEKTVFKCFYMAAQKLATIRPIIGLKDRIGYTVRFTARMPHTDHQAKVIVLALTTLLLLELGPLDIKEFSEED